ncbi:MAG TPA: helix-turn-helix transcriptional regulator [Chloroflexota bacterium]
MTHPNGTHRDGHPAFADLLRRYRARDGRSRTEIARRAGVNPSYVQRMEEGERGPASGSVITALARAMRLPPGERDALLLAAGRLPVALALLGEWDPVLEAVTAVLNDYTLETDELEDFRAVVLRICARWHHGGPRPTNGPWRR